MDTVKALKSANDQLKPLQGRLAMFVARVERRQAAYEASKVQVDTIKYPIDGILDAQKLAWAKKERARANWRLRNARAAAKDAAREVKVTEDQIEHLKGGNYQEAIDWEKAGRPVAVSTPSNDPTANYPKPTQEEVWAENSRRQEKKRRAAAEAEEAKLKQ